MNMIFGASLVESNLQRQPAVQVGRKWTLPVFGGLVLGPTWPAQKKTKKETWRTVWQLVC